MLIRDRPGRSATRHDPKGVFVVIMQRSLKRHGMEQLVDDLVAKGAPAFVAATLRSSHRLGAERAER